MTVLLHIVYEYTFIVGVYWIAAPCPCHDVTIYIRCLISSYWSPSMSERALVFLVILIQHDIFNWTKHPTVYEQLTMESIKTTSGRKLHMYPKNPTIHVKSERGNCNHMHIIEHGKNIWAHAILLIQTASTLKIQEHAFFPNDKFQYSLHWFGHPLKQS